LIISSKFPRILQIIFTKEILSKNNSTLSGEFNHPNKKFPERRMSTQDHAKSSIDGKHKRSRILGVFLIDFIWRKLIIFEQQLISFQFPRNLRIIFNQKNFTKNCRKSLKKSSKNQSLIDTPSRKNTPKKLYILWLKVIESYFLVF
jgi:hypothetical protein